MVEVSSLFDEAERLLNDEASVSLIHGRTGLSRKEIESVRRAMIEKGRKIGARLFHGKSRLKSEDTDAAHAERMVRRAEHERERRQDRRRRR